MFLASSDLHRVLAVLTMEKAHVIWKGSIIDWFGLHLWHSPCLAGMSDGGPMKEAWAADAQSRAQERAE